MKKSCLFNFYFFFLGIMTCTTMVAIVGPVIPGQSLWCINKRIASEVDNLESKLDNLCHATMITGPGVISTEGSYCLGNTIVGSLTIASSNVHLDLSNRRVTDGVIINSGLDRVSIENGTVEGGSDAITVNAGATNILINEVTAKNGTRGISLTGVTNAWVTNCEMVLNSTGIELTGSHNITVQNCVAGDNIFAGYSLISSTTNTIDSCKALNTGFGNTNIINNNVFGFVTINGNNNVFERCIANATQALSTTDQSSQIAGFAFRGTESCSKIIESEAAHGATSALGVTIPYGILLEGRFDGLTTVTSLTITSTTDIVRMVDWSPDGKYIAVVGPQVDESQILPEERTIFIYRFDRATQGFVLVDTTVAGSELDELTSVKWSPDGSFLVVGGEIEDIPSTDASFIIYQFSSVTEKITKVVPGAIPGGLPATFSWSPNGKYLAVAFTVASAGVPRLLITEFNPVEATLTPLALINPDGGSEDALFAVDWSPDGNYLLVGGSINGVTNNDLFIYQFNQENKAFAQVASVNPGGGGILDSVLAAQWSPNGIYLAAGGFFAGGTDNDLYIYRFNRTTNTLTEVASVNPGGGSVLDAVGSLEWSPDGKLLAVGLRAPSAGNNLYVYRFDASLETLTEIAATNPNGGDADEIFSISWSPDGQYFVIGGDFNGGGDVLVYRVMQFPFDNVITQNKVYCNSGSRVPGGIGISGSSICNLIINNTAYSNPVNPSIVGSNYQFVTNIFNQAFYSTPSPMQNISIDTCEPVCNAENLVMLVQQNSNKIVDIQSKVDALVNDINVLVDARGCPPTPLTAANIIAGNIELGTSGSYCLSSDLTTDITISTSCVSLDLSDHCLFGSLFLTGGEAITVKNGFIRIFPAPPDAISPLTGISISSAVNRSIIENVSIEGMDATEDSPTTIAGTAGIFTQGNQIQILNCTIRSGSASPTPVGGTAFFGGPGIWISDDADRTIVKNCLILGTGNGQPSTGAGGAGGGAGGNGIMLFSVGPGIQALTEIVNCTVLSTGNGGSASGGGGVGGDGGHAIFISENAIDTAVRGCTLRNTGTGGDAATPGNGGRAVEDLQTIPEHYSMIFSNFAHNIANSIKYNIQNTGTESGVLTPNPPTATVINPYANVYAS